jgi:DNA-binding LacI/PurR family transcriptional regulator
MNEAGAFLRSRADQLADYLRRGIARGEIREPLPNIRAWSVLLGVGRGTLEQAVNLLHREGVLDVQPRRGIRIARVRPRVSASDSPRMVRWLFYGRGYPDASVLLEILAAIVERLQAHDIQFRLERCDAARLRRIQHKGEEPHQMIILGLVPPGLQRMFSAFQRSALVIGVPPPDVPLPYISIDVEVAFRHALATFARRGCKRVSLVMREHSHSMSDARFAELCAEANAAMRSEMVRVPMTLVEQVAAARRFAARRTTREGVIALYPIPATVLISALLERGIAVPRDVEVVALNTTSMAVRAAPLPDFYPYPVEAFAKAVSRAVLRYFQSGTVPRLRKMIPLEVVRAR